MTAPPNKPLQRRPRSEFLIVPQMPFAAPLNAALDIRVRVPGSVLRRRYSEPIRSSLSVAALGPNVYDAPRRLKARQVCRGGELKDAESNKPLQRSARSISSRHPSFSRAPAERHVRRLWPDIVT